MTSPPEMPGFDDLIEDLRLLRRHGLVRLRRLHLAALERLAAAPQLPPGTLPDAMEALLRKAVAGFGDGSLGEAASYTFGLTQGTRDWPAQDRRRRAAEIYGVSVERFRKHQERTVFEQVAEQILRAVRPPDLTSDWSWDLDAPVPSIQFGQRIDLMYPVPGAADVPVTVHVVTVELLTDIDVVVSPTNVHLEVAKTYSSTIAGRLRTTAAWRDATGRIYDDVLARELSDWLAAHDGYGATVAAGTVVPTSAGALAAQRIRRLYHAAVAVPRPASNDYYVAPETVARAVREVFALARWERDAAALPLTSLCFPLIGAGRGGMPVAASIEVLWWALTAELARDPGWRIHLVDREADRALLLLAHLLSNGAQAA
jgi:O-acetyl-ADP-ribose deacetylase (regulator of RNase III)